MFKFLFTTCLAFATAGAVQAQDAPSQTPGTLGLTADGTWDCRDSTDDYLGAVVVADLSYAFINPDATVGGYGKLNKDDWLDAPGFFILSGELKERFAAVSLLLYGPTDNPNDFTDWDKLMLKVVVTPGIQFLCARRHGPAP